MQFFEKVGLPACGEKHICSHPQIGNTSSLHYVVKSSAR